MKSNEKFISGTEKKKQTHKKTKQAEKKNLDKRELISSENWIILGETVKGSGNNINGGQCETCNGTGYMLIGGGDNTWCGCINCKENAMKFHVE